MSRSGSFAEGYERISPKETVNFLNYAKGSSAELRTQIYIGIDIGYIDREVGNQWLTETKEISRRLYGLIQAFKKA